MTERTLGGRLERNTDRVPVEVERALLVATEAFVEQSSKTMERVMRRRPVRTAQLGLGGVTRLRVVRAALVRGCVGADDIRAVGAGHRVFSGLLVRSVAAVPGQSIGK